MKRFLAFKGSRYYPNKGWEDFIGDFSTPVEAIKFVQEFNPNDYVYAWGQVVDTMEVGENWNGRHNIGKVIWDDDDINKED